MAWARSFAVNAPWIVSSAVCVIMFLDCKCCAALRNIVFGKSNICFVGFVSVFALSLHKIRGGVEGGSCAVGPWAGCGSVGWSGRVTLAVSRHGGVMAGASFAYFSVAAVVAIAVGNPRMGLASNVRDRDAGLASVTMITAM